jgi:hypothetical protein
MDAVTKFYETGEDPQRGNPDTLVEGKKTL